MKVASKFRVQITHKTCWVFLLEGWRGWYVEGDPYCTQCSRLYNDPFFCYRIFKRRSWVNRLPLIPWRRGPRLCFSPQQTTESPPSWPNSALATPASSLPQRYRERERERARESERERERERERGLKKWSICIASCWKKRHCLISIITMHKSNLKPFSRTQWLLHIKGTPFNPPVCTIFLFICIIKEKTCLMFFSIFSIGIVEALWTAYNGPPALCWSIQRCCHLAPD